MRASQVLSIAAGSVVLALGASVPARAAAPTVIAVSMANRPDGAQVMRLDREEVPPGRVTFRVRNDSKDTVHEFLVVRTDMTPDRSRSPRPATGWTRGS